MKHYCGQCGQAIESDADAAQVTCPACGHVTQLSAAMPAGGGVKKPRFGITAKDIVIGLISVACLVLLILLFLRPNEPTRQIIFGSLGPAPAAPTAGADGTTPGGSMSIPGATVNGNGSLPSLAGQGSLGGGLSMPRPPAGSVTVPGSPSPAPGSVGAAPADSTNDQSPGTPTTTIAVGGTGVHVSGRMVTHPPGWSGGPITPLNLPAATTATVPSTATEIRPGLGRPEDGASVTSAGTIATSLQTTTGSTNSESGGTNAPVNQPVTGAGSTVESPTASPGTSPSIDPNTGLPAGTPPTSQTGGQSTSTAQSGAAPSSNPPTSTTPATTAQPTGTQTGLASARTYTPATPATSATPDASQPDNPPDQGNAPEQVSKQKTQELLLLAKNDSKAIPQYINLSNPFDAQHGTNVAFVLDRSLSMRDSGKSVVARNKMVDTLRDLGTNKTFYIIFFPYKPMPADAPLPATDANINAMTNWIFSTGHAFGSNPQKAMAKALEFKPDTVWLLSGGEFSVDVAEEIRAANKLVQSTINTVGFYSRENETILRRIAEQNGGHYRFVPPPDENQGINPAPVSETGAGNGPAPRSP